MWNFSGDFGGLFYDAGSKSDYQDTLERWADRE
jgi:hypothetical protein